MKTLLQVVQNKCIVVPFLLWFFIQCFKFVYEIIKNKKINFKRLLGAGGMPSSHSAVVCSVATIIGKTEGVDSTIFALSIIVAAVVMYDASGIRRAAGKQARILNKLIETPGLTPIEVQERLIETLGHTPVEVFVGALLGIAVGIIV